ncbi:cytidine/deoxycytidylate deaminase family protein [Nitzschia inconspicua]|uniref:Cytidine/deoxycytidylate deaminase family protein n=1 Tax=Nitzschia inconspicua TaxID=303405 RepID=A0A9K3PNJ3_9STRA|nr:cytidine/deoxycytidylate deaminase family protein [Nitzschia inconspicua]
MSSSSTSPSSNTEVAESLLRPYDKSHLQASFDMARQAYQNGCMPFGAVLADGEGNVLVSSSNPTPAVSERGGAKHADPTGHAETTLLRTPTWWSLSKEERQQATLYSSTEPCVMCAGAIYWSGIGRLVYGCTALALEEQVSGPGGFDIPVKELYGMARPGARHIDIVGPVLEEEALKVHKDSGVWCRPAKP